MFCGVLTPYSFCVFVHTNTKIKIRQKRPFSFANVHSSFKVRLLCANISDICTTIECKNLTATKKFTLKVKNFAKRVRSSLEKSFENLAICIDKFVLLGYLEIALGWRVSAKFKFYAFSEK